MSDAGTKYVFVTGGVVSALGKGIVAASLGRLLKARGLRVQAQKFDPYLNVDPGTMSPFQHGEVFVTGSTLRYGSNFCACTRRPRALRSRPSDAATIPLPSAETTPPVTKMYLVWRSVIRVASPGRRDREPRASARSVRRAIVALRGR